MKSEAAPGNLGGLILPMAQMYFIALVAAKEIDDAVLGWKRLVNERFGCTAALRSPAHITLVPPFWMESIVEEPLGALLSGLSQVRKPLEVKLKDFASFPPRVIYVDLAFNTNLQELRDSLNTSLLETKLVKISTDDRPFHPHITIATRDLRKKDFAEAWEIFRNKKYETSWLATGVSILRHNQEKWEVIKTTDLKNY